VAHVVVGILASALSVWLLASAWSFRRVLTDERQQHHLVNGLGLLRSALLLKAILLFSGMVLGCFTFSIAVALLLLL
jgi:cell division protein FtsX